MSFELAKKLYLSYLEKLVEAPSLELYATVEDIFKVQSFENPITSIDFNNLGVIALLEAESMSEAFEQSSLMALALEFFQTGYQLDSNPLCKVHLAILYWLSEGDLDRMADAFKAFIDSLQLDFSETLCCPTALVFLPGGFSKSIRELAPSIFSVTSAYTQARILACCFMLSATIFFYNETGLRVLDILYSLLPSSASIRFRLGICLFINSKIEGVLHLHESQLLQPNSPEAYHALYLSYGDMSNTIAQNYWHQKAFNLAVEEDNSISKQGWQWAVLPTNNPFTYVPFDGILLATEASLRSIVTSVLLVDGDWVEPEMKFWRNYLKPGMVVLDIGANVGVYTFSAAMRVGSTGRVIAVEPTSLCVQCLHETIRVNDLQQVSVHAVAASDTEGSLSFRVSSSSEFNEVVTNPTPEETSLLTIPCLPLDTIWTRENIQRVDLIKIDAEGHELSVLKGSLHILSTFYPVILYENRVGIGKGNYSVYEFFQAQGYELYRYHSFSNKLIKIASAEDLSGLLNVIAIYDKGEISEWVS